MITASGPAKVSQTIVDSLETRIVFIKGEFSAGAMELANSGFAPRDVTHFNLPSDYNGQKAVFTEIVEKRETPIVELESGQPFFGKEYESFTIQTLYFPELDETRTHRETRAHSFASMLDRSRIVAGRLLEVSDRCLTIETMGGNVCQESVGDYGPFKELDSLAGKRIKLVQGCITYHGDWSSEPALYWDEVTDIETNVTYRFEFDR